MTFYTSSTSSSLCYLTSSNISEKSATPPKRTLALSQLSQYASNLAMQATFSPSLSIASWKSRISLWHFRSRIYLSLSSSLHPCSSISHHSYVQHRIRSILLSAYFTETSFLAFFTNLSCILSTLSIFHYFGILNSSLILLGFSKLVSLYLSILSSSFATVSFLTSPSSDFFLAPFLGRLRLIKISL